MTTELNLSSFYELIDRNRDLVFDIHDFTVNTDAAFLRESSSVKFHSLHDIKAIFKDTVTGGSSRERQEAWRDFKQDYKKDGSITLFKGLNLDGSDAKIPDKLKTASHNPKYVSLCSVREHYWILSTAGNDRVITKDELLQKIASYRPNVWAAAAFAEANTTSYGNFLLDGSYESGLFDFQGDSQASLASVAFFRSAFSLGSFFMAENFTPLPDNTAFLYENNCRVLALQSFDDPTVPDAAVYYSIPLTALDSLQADEISSARMNALSQDGDVIEFTVVKKDGSELDYSYNFPGYPDYNLSNRATVLRTRSPNE